MTATGGRSRLTVCEAMLSLSAPRSTPTPECPSPAFKSSRVAGWQRCAGSPSHPRLPGARHSALRFLLCGPRCATRTHLDLRCTDSGPEARRKRENHLWPGEGETHLESFAEPEQLALNPDDSRTGRGNVHASSCARSRCPCLKVSVSPLHSSESPTHLTSQSPELAWAA